MIRLIFCLCLAAAHLTRSANVQTIYEKASSRHTVTFRVSTPKVIRCEVITNNNETFILDKHNDEPPNTYFTKPCSLSVTADRTAEGFWTMTAVYRDENGMERAESITYNLKIRQEIKKEDVFPAQDIKVFRGDFVSVHMSGTFDNVTSCTAIDEQKREYEFSRDGPADEPSVFLKNGQCWVRMKFDGRHTTEWKLYAHMGNDEVREGMFRLILNHFNKTNNVQTITDEYAERGSPHQIVFEQSAVYCQVRNPQGKIVHEQRGPCVYNIPKVSSYHEGVWEAVFHLQGYNRRLTTNVKLHVYDNAPLNATVTYSENGHINLLCRFGNSRFTVCRFERPDGSMIFVNPGTGDGKYEYYGEGFNYFMYHQDCGITILEPNPSDFGVWRCIVDPKDKSSVAGSVLHVKRETTDSTIPWKVHVPVGKVYVQRGGAFQVACKANAVLDYCWLKSPNGTSYATDGGDGKEHPRDSLPYHGSGLSLGECGAIVTGANDSDNGEWSCHMGLDNGPDLEARVSVRVTESSVMAEEEKIKLGSADMPITLSCLPIPGAEFDIDYCRWIHPDGTAIHYETDDRYLLKTSRRRCELLLTGIQYNDIGQWTCVVGASHNGAGEQSASINVSCENDNVYLVSLSISTAVFVTVVLFAVFMYRNRFQRRIVEKPIDFKYLI